MRQSKLVGAVSNPDLSGSRLSRCNRGESGQAVSTYHDTYAVRLKTAPTGGESVHLFLESTINGYVKRENQKMGKSSTNHTNLSESLFLAKIRGGSFSRFHACSFSRPLAFTASIPRQRNTETLTHFTGRLLFHLTVTDAITTIHIKSFHFDPAGQ